MLFPRNLWIFHPQEVLSAGKRPWTLRLWRRQSLEGHPTGAPGSWLWAADPHGQRTKSHRPGPVWMVFVGTSYMNLDDFGGFLRPFLDQRWPNFFGLPTHDIFWATTLLFCFQGQEACLLLRSQEGRLWGPVPDALHSATVAGMRCQVLILDVFDVFDVLDVILVAVFMDWLVHPCCIISAYKQIILAVLNMQKPNEWWQNKFALFAQL